jgi:hypothetical protein
MRLWKTILPVLGLSAGLALVSSSTAQDPKGPDRKGDAKSEGRGDARGGLGMLRPAAAKVDPKVEIWLKTLAEKITDAHDEIRDSARAGLVAAGSAAVPTLQQIAQSDDSARANAARKLIEQIRKPEIEWQMKLAAAGIAVRTASAELAPSAATPAPQANAKAADPRPDRPADGRPRPGPDGRPPNPFESLLKDLKLEERQEKQANEVMDEFREAMQKLREQVNDGKLTREESQPKRDELQKAMMKDMKDILGDQFAKFEEAMKNMPRPGRRPEVEERPKP